MNDNKTAATEFLQMIIDGKIDEAYDMYVDMNGKHHNIFTPAGMPALREGMKAADTHFPNKAYVVKNVIAEGDLVAIHSHLTLDPEKMDFAAVHILRFDNGKIVEFWDVAGDLVGENIKIVNEDGAF